MKEEFNLSEMRFFNGATKDGYLYFEEDVKEFIKRDRKLVQAYMHGDITWTELREKQDKLAGDTLK